MDVLGSVFGFGRRFSGAATYPEDRKNQTDPADVNPSDLEAGTAPSSPIGVQHSVDIADGHRHVSQTEVLFDQAEVDIDELMSDPIQDLEFNGAEGVWPHGPKAGNGRDAVGPAPVEARKLAPPPFVYADRGEYYNTQSKTEEAHLLETESEQQSVRFVPPSTRKAASQPEPTRSSIPRTYWQDLAPEADFLRRAAHQIRSFGSDERAQHRVRILASATDAARAELVVIANSMLVDVTRAQNLIIEALRLPEGHPTRTYILGDEVRRRDPNDQVPMPKPIILAHNPNKPSPGDGVQFVNVAPIPAKNKAADSTWLKFLANDPGPTLVGNTDDPAPLPPKRRSWVDTGLQNMGLSKKVANFQKQENSPIWNKVHEQDDLHRLNEPPQKAQDLPPAQIPSNLRKPKENLQFALPKPKKSDGSFEAANLYAADANPIAMGIAVEDPNRAPSENAPKIDATKNVDQDIVDGDEGFNHDPKRKPQERLPVRALSHAPYLLGLDGAMSIPKDIPMNPHPTKDESGKLKKFKGVPESRVQNEYAGETTSIPEAQEIVWWHLQHDMDDNLRRLQLESSLQSMGSGGNGEHDYSVHVEDSIEDDPFASLRSNSLEKSVLKRVESSGRRRKPIGKTLADEGIFSWHGD